MDRTTVRGIAFWMMAVASVLWLMTTAIYALLPLLPSFYSSQRILGFLQTIGVCWVLIGFWCTGSLLIFLGLLHYDLVTAKRLSEHARDYLIRDLTQSPQDNISNHG